LRLLHVVPSYLPATRYGGPIYSVHALCAALVRQGHEVEVFTTNVDGPSVSAVPVGRPVDIDGVNVTYFATGLGRRLYRSPTMRTALQVRAADFDALHLHSVFLWPTLAASRAAERAGVPYLISPRGMLVADLIRKKSTAIKTAWIRLFEARNIAGAAAVHMTSEVEEDEFRRLGLVARRIVVVPNGVEAPAEHSCRLRRVGHSSCPTVLSLGRISWKKGLDRLIPAMAHVEGARLLIVGNDEEGYRPTLEQLALAHGVASRVEFKGAVHGDAKWELMAAADLFVLASYSENFGNVVLEAMACGVPVVVTPEVGLASTVRASQSGLVVDGDPAILGRALAELLARPDERQRLGANGRICVAGQFSWDAIANSMVAIYAEVGSGSRRAACPV
jgi:glycosyltransferase involved in cell wall biosynthesis